jgi:hypothetical protein
VQLSIPNQLAALAKEMAGGAALRATGGLSWYHFGNATMSVLTFTFELALGCHISSIYPTLP